MKSFAATRIMPLLDVYTDITPSAAGANTAYA